MIAEAECSKRQTFNTTHWSVILATGRTDGHHSHEAWNKVAESYWLPVYAFIRRQGHGEVDAQDLTQDFFVHLFTRQAFEGLIPGQSRFRSFLLVCLKNFLTSRYRSSQAARRRPKNGFVPFDGKAAEATYQAELVDYATPESEFERQWAVAVLNHTLDLLAQRYAKDGKQEYFEHLAPHLVGGDGSTTNAELASQLNTTEDAVKTAKCRLRQRFRALLREEIAATVPNAEIDDELRHLLSVLTR